MEWHRVKIHCKVSGDSLSMLLSSEALGNMTRDLGRNKEIEIRSEDVYDDDYILQYFLEKQQFGPYKAFQDSLVMDLKAICIIENDNIIDTPLYGPEKLNKEVPSDDIIEVFV